MKRCWPAISPQHLPLKPRGYPLSPLELHLPYQTDLLRDLEEGEEISHNAIRELYTDLSLQATKETAKSIGHSMSALVATERHLWINLSNIEDQGKSFLMDTPLSPSGLFGDTVTSSRGFRRKISRRQYFRSRRSQVSGDAGQEHSQPSTSSSHRVLRS